MIPSFTLVVGVDTRHLRQLIWTWPTWKRHKPGLLKHPMIAFFDPDQVEEDEIRKIVDHPNLHCISWPLDDAIWPKEWTSEKDKWTELLEKMDPEDFSKYKM